MTEKSPSEQLASLEPNGDFFEKLRQLDEKLNGSSADCCLCYCHKAAPAESATQTSKYLNGYANGTSSCSTASIQTQTSTETDTNNSLDAEHEKPYPMNGHTNGSLAAHRNATIEKSDFSTQTLSTGDIVITKVYFEENAAS